MPRDVVGRAARAVRHQPAGVDRLAELEHRRQARLLRQLGDPQAGQEEHAAAEDEHGVGLLGAQRRERGVDLGRRARREHGRADAERLGGVLDDADDDRSHALGRVDQEPDACRLRQHLLQQLDLLGDELRRLSRDAGDVASGPREALHETGGDRIGDVRPHDRNRRRRLPRRERDLGERDDEDVGAQAHELVGKLGETVEVALDRDVVAVLDVDVAALDVTVVGEAALELVQERADRFGRPEIADQRRPSRLGRGGERSCDDAAGERLQERPPSGQPQPRNCSECRCA